MKSDGERNTNERQKRENTEGGGGVIEDNSCGFSLCKRWKDKKGTLTKVKLRKTVWCVGRGDMGCICVYVYDNHMY